MAWHRRPSSLRPLVRGVAAGSLVAAIFVPVVRRRLRVPAPVTIAAVASGPLALAVLRPRTKTRDALLFALQMWAFTMAHELPYDQPERLRRRLRVRYPVAIDRALGLGRLPTARLQGALFTSGHVTFRDRVLTWVHWLWFLEPHLALIWILARDDRRFPRAARQMAAAYDVGCLGYFAVPTAPPWWAAEHGYTDGEVRRMMVEVGEQVWGDAWPVLYESLGGNPWAAMPSLHFATAVLAAILLSESGALAGVVGWAYAGMLGFSLVYLGEHYVVDLLAGLLLVAAVRRGEPLAEPYALAVSRGLQRLERIANA